MAQAPYAVITVAGTENDRIPMFRVVDTRHTPPKPIGRIYRSERIAQGTAKARNEDWAAEQRKSR